MLRISHYRSKCIGCNGCVEAAPERWRISVKDGKSVLIGSTEKKGVYSIVVHDFEAGQNRLAARNCPVNTIKIVQG